MFDKKDSVSNNEIPSSNDLFIVDMHCHSSYSDGTMTPEQIAKILFDSGFNMPLSQTMTP